MGKLGARERCWHWAPTGPRQPFEEREGKVEKGGAQRGTYALVGGGPLIQIFELWGGRSKKRVKDKGGEEPQTLKRKLKKKKKGAKVQKREYKAGGQRSPPDKGTRVGAKQNARGEKVDFIWKYHQRKETS